MSVNLVSGKLEQTFLKNIGIRWTNGKHTWDKPLSLVKKKNNNKNSSLSVFSGFGKHISKNSLSRFLTKIF